MAKTHSEISALLDSQSEAIRIKDIDRLMSLYSPDIVYFDVVPRSDLSDLRAPGSIPGTV